MNVFNRVFLVIYSLLWIAACAGLATMAWNEGQMLDIAAGEFTLQAFIASTGLDRWIFTAMMALLGLIGLITLITALRPSAGGTRGYVRLKASDGGTVEVSASAVEAILRSEIESIPGIRQVTPVVDARGGIVETDLTVSVDPGASINDVTHIVNDATARVLREQVGATQARRPSLHITYDEIAARPAGTLRTQAPGAGTVPPPPPPKQDAAASPPPAGESVPPPPPSTPAQAPLATGAQGETARADGTDATEPPDGDTPRSDPAGDTLAFDGDRPPEEDERRE